MIFPFFVLAVKFSTQLLFYVNSGNLKLPESKDYLLSVLLGYAGIIFGYLLNKYLIRGDNKTMMINY